jgi:hypothetical protein
MATTTRPAPSFESAAFIPAAARLTPLALAALEQGCSDADVAAYLNDRASYLSAPYRLIAVGIECLGSAGAL